MTLSNNDVSGERGEGYVLIPVAARTRNPSFWGWPASYPMGSTYNERPVRVLEDGEGPTDQRIYHQDTKNEFRLCTVLYFAGHEEGDLLEVIREPAPGVDFEYRVHAHGSDEYGDLQGAASTWVGSSNKRWGYRAE